jgi:hypothetical protein
MSYHFLLTCGNQFCKYFSLGQNQGGSARQGMKYTWKMRNVRNALKNSLKHVIGRDCFGDQYVDRRVILKIIMN